jgi:hypothetical protein
MRTSARWFGRTVAAVALVLVVGLVVTAALRWLFSGNGHPFGDVRACAGTDLPLEQVLDAKGITLPPGATDVHYIAHSTPRAGKVALAVGFRSTRQAMEAYLVNNGLQPGLAEHLDEGPFTAGDVTDAPGLCENTAHPPAVQVPQRSTTTAETFGIAVEVSGHTVRDTTAVVLTAPMSGPQLPG